MLHLLLLNWFHHHVGQSNDDRPQPLPADLIRTELLRPATPAPAAAAPAPPKIARTKVAPPAPLSGPMLMPATPEPLAVAAATAAPVLDSTPAAATDLPSDMPFNGPDIAGTSVEPGPVAASTQTLPDAGSARYRVDPPPSATLKYDVSALREGQKVYGHGTIDWAYNGRDYVIQGEAGVLFFSVLNFSSKGQTDDFGIAPVTYTEKRFRRAPTHTRFNRERNLIGFSASQNFYPLQGGEQDRASIIWQLAGIGRGDQARFVPEATIALFIAGARDGETWQIRVVGEEDIAVGPGKLRTWHVRRAPRAGTNDQIIDIWLAPEREWYPVKLRFTETNGEYLDMSLSAILPDNAR